jgi:hypothetical protein
MDKSPKAAVSTPIPVITHDKERILGNHHRAKIVPWLYMSWNNGIIFIGSIGIIVERIIDE